MVPRTSIAIGQKFGRLTIVRELEPKVFPICKARVRMFECTCDCGVTRINYLTTLTRGTTTSCGCFKRENAKIKYTTHGNSSESWILNGIKQRCNNSNHPDYHRYGGRGISVCDRWMKYENFIQDMGRRPSMDYSVERIDNNGNYCPENCKWATKSEQSRNTRYNKIVSHEGKSQCIAQWAEDLEINYGTLQSRLWRGMETKKALTPFSKKL